MKLMRELTDSLTMKISGRKEGLALLMKHCDPKEKSLLDYGCGRGECLEFARDAGFNVKGADIDPKCVEFGEPPW